MTEGKGSSLSFDRILLIVLSVLLVLALIYIGIDIFSKDDSSTAQEEPAVVEENQPEDAPAATLPPEEPQEQEPEEEEVVVVEVTPTPRRLEVPPTPTAFSVDSEEDPRAILDLSNPDVFDYFNKADDWYDYDSAGFASYQVIDGQLVGTDYDPEKRAVYWSYNSRPSGNAYVEISATNGDCIAKDSVGLVMRIDAQQTPSGYALEVSCDGAWRFLRYRPAGASAEVYIDWTPSDVINTGNGATNRLGVWGYAGKFNLFINNTQVGEYFDRNYSYSYGYFAAYVRAAATYDLPAYFDDFAIWDIPFIP
ncbi:MAG: hypothetical protein PVI81_06900 [Anaerolineales bacterium]|jgi:hypothetical protein